jgi:hypothetical protein
MIRDSQKPTSDVHLAGLPRETKGRWVKAAQLAGKPMARWIEDVVDMAAAEILAPREQTQASPPLTARPETR